MLVCLEIIQLAVINEKLNTISQEINILVYYKINGKTKFDKFSILRIVDVLQRKHQLNCCKKQ